MAYASLTKSELSDIAAQLTSEYNAWKEKNLSLNMARGKPSAAQLDLALGVLETLKARYEFANSKGNDVRNYGIWDGLPEMKQIFSDMIGIPPQQIILGNNSSLLIMFDVISRGYSHGFNGCKPWAKQDQLKFLCPVPGYDRHFAVTEYFGFEMINIPMSETGPDMDLVEKLVAEDESIKGIWCVPKYSNPTGITYSDETVRRFASLRPAAKDFKIMWDNAYCVHDLTDTPDHLLDIYDECMANGTEDMLMIFASTSKISFPGAGVACVATSDRNIVDLKKHFMTQTIGPDKMNQLRHVLFLHDIHGVRDLMKGHRAILEPKFKLCQRMLKEQLGDLEIAAWNEPNGGYFISVDVMDGCAKRVVQLCKEAGVILTDAGATYPYGNDPHDSNIRLAPSFPPLEELEQAMEVFCTAIKLAAAEKLLSA
ncbi:MAG: aminotransferase class I/II-fold pyridoxal phosphate-dependent enzyme [Clostridia bacterium]|nr:aminotransferase class I/II-fold pyridoxal phosphate-dependent enzyme [Clostridia bacterium]